MVGIAYKQEEISDVKVAILTPYLIRSFSDIKDPEEMKAQIEKFGFDPDNLAGTSSLFTPKGKVVRLETCENHTLASPMLADLVISGCAGIQEIIVRAAMSTGAVIARYSIFYGKPSEYTGLLPEEAGFALDIPKNVKTVKSMLTNDELLDALVSREHSKIQEAIKALNRNLSEPILITHHLESVLKHPKCKM